MSNGKIVRTTPSADFQLDLLSLCDKYEIAACGIVCLQVTADHSSRVFGLAANKFSAGDDPEWNDKFYTLFIEYLKSKRIVSR